ncbi:MAG: TatD family hydrolase [Treponema sp.]|nr:TatD family hydrolase [Treponema sp.]
MYCDAHCHPWDCIGLIKSGGIVKSGGAVKTGEIKNSAADDMEAAIGGTAFAASSWNLEQFEYHEGLAARLESNAPAVLCFALHPQFPAYALSPDFMRETGNHCSHIIEDTMLLLQTLAKAGRLGAVGETGFDLFDDKYRQTEKLQEEIFINHLETAIKYNLPMVVHVRKAMHKVFAYVNELKKLPAVIFHSWHGTTGEGDSLLCRGVNAFFSFGAAIVNNHKLAQISCAHFPIERILFETDAPYIPPQGKTFSSWADLPLTYSTAAHLRSAPVPEDVIQNNFFRAFDL